MQDYTTSQLIQKRAKRLRKKSTLPEKMVWSWLKDSKVNTLKFRRQFPLGKYILDFYCYEKKLCIELDGKSHASIQQQEKDYHRDKFLHQQGIKVLRIQNQKILREPSFLKDMLTVFLASPHLSGKI